MTGNTFGKAFTITTFGESHGPALGVVIDGCPPNISFDLNLVQTELNRRRPGQSKLSSQRNEADEFEVLSGVYEGKTLGTPIAIIVRNKDARSQDYAELAQVYRPSHADYTYQTKYGIRDPRGGGRQSARETIARVLGGAVAKMVLRTLNVSIQAYVSAVNQIELQADYSSLDLTQTENNEVRCPDKATAEAMMHLIEEATEAGDSLGGTISCVIKNVPVGWGDPVFDKLHADFAKAMTSINAVKGFEIGSGFGSVKKLGSEHNDEFVVKDGKVSTKTNNSGGIQGGISNGEDIFFKVAFKPVASIKKDQNTLSSSHETVKINIQGRHDSCVVPRAVPIVEAMAAIVLVDHYLRQNAIVMQPFA